jgi:hypothetical protein
MNYIVNKKNGQAPKKVSPEEEKQKLWINAWYDPLANICVHSNCMTFSDINSDGDFKLLVANSGNNPLFRTNNQDLGHKLKVYKGKLSLFHKINTFNRISNNLLIIIRNFCYK